MGQKAGTSQAFVGGPILGQMAGTSQAFYPGYIQMMMNHSLGKTANTNAVLTGQQMAGGTTCHNNTNMHAVSQAKVAGLILGQMAGTSQAFVGSPIVGQMAGTSQAFYPDYNRMMMNHSLGKTATTNAVLTGQQMAGGTTCHTGFIQMDAHAKYTYTPHSSSSSRHTKRGEIDDFV